MITLSALDVLRNTDHETLVVVSDPQKTGLLLMHVLTAQMMSLLFCCHGADSEMYSWKVLRSTFAYFLVSLASCTAGISIHPDIPRQTLMLSQHGCRQASFSLPLQGQFIPNLLSM